MAIEKTYEELLASNINSRNYSSILPIIYSLRKRAQKNYIPSAPKRIIYYAGDIGDGGSAIFNSINSSYAKGAEITITGTANYLLSDITAGINLLKPATSIIAYIDSSTTKEAFSKKFSSSTSQPDIVKNQGSYREHSIPALATQIDSDGSFNFKIPSSVTSQLIVGTHYIYLDAIGSNPKTPIRLNVIGSTTDRTDPLWNVRTFTIT